MKTTVKFYKKYIPWIALTFVLLFGQAMCELALPGYMADIIDKGVLAGDMSYTKQIGLIMCIIAALTLLCSVGAGFLGARVATGGSREIRRSLFNKVTSFSTAELDKFSTASLITRSTNDIQMVQQATIMVIRMGCFAPIMGIGALIRALQTSVPMSWTLITALLAILAIMAVSFIAIFPKFKVLQSKLDRVNLIMKERLEGILVIRAFTTEKAEENRFDIANLDLMKINLFVNKAMTFMLPLLFFVMNAISILIVWAGAKLIDEGNLMVGDMMAYLQYAMHVIMSFLFITMIFIMIPRAMVSAQRIGEVLDTELSIEDPSDDLAKAPAANAGSEITFDNVSFAYPDAEANALSDISFVAEPGKTTAIIGGTGCGKSTLINLIPRFYDVTAGSVKVDGIDVREMKQADLRKRIGYVPQKGLLFSGTIASNIMYGDENATEDDINRAIEIAQAKEFIDEKPEGINEEVAQGGTNVSGGQKQRLSIARALIRKPAIYIFDDSFSALDFATDKKLRNALKENVGESTIIIVAQRINTIMDADQILVLDEGRMVGKGTHDELLETCDVYKEIALSQLSEEELERRGSHE